MEVSSRKRACVLIKEGETILLMRRVKNGAEYFVLPGGSVEEGEDIVTAAKREAKEETGLNVVIDKELWKIHHEADNRDHYYFLVTEYSGTIKLGGPEIDRVSETNQYFLEWHDLHDLQALTFFPKEIKRKVLENF